MKPLPGHGIFENLHRASFLGRPNRFAVECLFRNEKIVAYLPNPGRLWELLFPGSPLYLAKTGSVLERKTDYICIAVEKDGVPVMLHTHHTNRIVQQLIECEKVPGLEGYRIVRPEVSYGKSRFDFLLQKDGSPFMLEVKSCTLFGREIAMFPDAATMRGVKHIEDLVHLTRSGGKGGMLFLVH